MLRQNKMIKNNKFISFFKIRSQKIIEIRGKGKMIARSFKGNNTEWTTYRRVPALTNFLVTNLQK